MAPITRTQKNHHEHAPGESQTQKPRGLVPSNSGADESATHRTLGQKQKRMARDNLGPPRRQAYGRDA